MTEEVSAAVKRGMVISLGMLKKAFSAQFSLSLQCEQPVKVQITSDSAWLTTNQTSLTLEPNHRQTVDVVLDTGSLEGGQFYTGIITITIPTAEPTIVRHWVMFGTKKFLGAKDAKDGLNTTLPEQLDSVVLGPAYVESMFREARQARIDGDIGKSAAAYANAIRFMINPRSDPDIVVSPDPTPAPQIAALSQRWHRLVLSLEEKTEKSTSDLDRLNWIPEVQWSEHVPLHLLPLWKIKKEDHIASAGAGDPQGKRLDRLNAEFAVDCLTGELLKAHLPAQTVNRVSSPYGIIVDEVSSGDFVIQREGRYWVAKLGERQLWKVEKPEHYTIVIGQHRVYFYNKSCIISLDRDSGREIWKRDFDFSRYIRHNIRFVEVAGVLLAMSISFLSAGNDNDDYHYLQHFTWWNADTGTPMGEAQFPIGKGKHKTDFSICYAVEPLTFQVMRVIVGYEQHIYDTVLFGYQANTSGVSFLDWGKNWTRADACIFEEHTPFSPFGYVKISDLHMLGKHTCLVILLNPGVFLRRDMR